MDTHSHDGPMPEQSSERHAHPVPSRQRTDHHASSQPAQGQKYSPGQSLLPFSPMRLAHEAQTRAVIRQSLIDALEPTNIIEEKAIDVLTGLSWELQALERCRFYALEFARREALLELLVGRLDQAHALIQAMYKGDQAASDQIDAALQRFGISAEAIEAQTYLIALDTVDRLNRLAAQTQIRFDMQLRQIERRRPLVGSEQKADLRSPDDMPTAIQNETETA